MTVDWNILLNRALWVNVSVVFAATVVLYWALLSLLGVASRRLRRRAEAHHTLLRELSAEMLARTSRLLVLGLALMLSLKLVELPPRWALALGHGWFFVLAFQVALWLDGAVQLWQTGTPEREHVHNPVTATIIGIMLRLVVWTLLLLSLLANVGVDITALIAGLGVGGIAIALAVQTLLSDLFASLSIGIDKPFEIGDFVVFSDIAGTIERIGLKTTRIRSLSGEQIICANADLLSRTIHNYKRMETRRIEFQFGVHYQTPAEKLRAVSSLVADIIGGMEGVRFDRAHFARFAQNQLTFEVVYIVHSADYNRYMDLQQEINLALVEGLRRLQVSLATPRRVELPSDTQLTVTEVDPPTA